MTYQEKGLDVFGSRQKELIEGMQMYYKNKAGLWQSDLRLGKARCVAKTWRRTWYCIAVEHWRRQVFTSSTLVCWCRWTPVKYKEGNTSIAALCLLQRLPHSSAYEAVFNPRVVEPYQANPNIPCPFGVWMKRISQQVHALHFEVLPCNKVTIPTWHLDTQFCKDLLQYKKSEMSGNAFKLIFLEHLQQCHTDSIHIYTDGSKTGHGVGYAAISPSEIESTMKHLYSQQSYMQSSTHSIVRQLQEWLLRIAARHKHVQLCWALA